jgi:hypothetical protein
MSGVEFRSEAGLFRIRKQGMAALLLSIDRLLPVTDQHMAAGGTELWTIFLEAGQYGKIALIHQLAAETLHVAYASLLVLIGPAVSEGANGNRDIQQEKRHQEFVHCVSSFRFQATSAIVGHAAVHSITIA